LRPYRVTALLNAALCQAQLGERENATRLYQQVLREAPGNALARVSLRMLGASPDEAPTGAETSSMA
jgi:Tfp pilus assembly protein PilF